MFENEIEFLKKMSKQTKIISKVRKFINHGKYRVELRKLNICFGDNKQVKKLQYLFLKTERKS